jgi:DNA polymerase-3 subunit gamma/tau
MASQLAHNCALLQWAEGHLTLSLDPTAEQLRSPKTEQRLREALQAVLGGPLRLEIRISRPNQETPAQRRVREQAQRQQAAVQSMDDDPVALRLREQLDAHWVPGSVEPTD